MPANAITEELTTNLEELSKVSATFLKKHDTLHMVEQFIKEEIASALPANLHLYLFAERYDCTHTEALHLFITYKDYSDMYKRGETHCFDTLETDALKEVADSSFIVQRFFSLIGEPRLVFDITRENQLRFTVKTQCTNGISTSCVLQKIKIPQQSPSSFLLISAEIANYIKHVLNHINPLSTTQ